MLPAYTEQDISEDLKTTAVRDMPISDAVVTAAKTGPSFYDLAIDDINGKRLPIANFKGKVLLIANTASKCGFTTQYRDLELLFKAYVDRGFIVLGVPSNDFGNQEPLNANEIKSFCQLRFGVTFPLGAKTTVKGEQKHALFDYLTQHGPPETQGEIGWNFEKFIIDKKGVLRGRFGSFTNPMSSRVKQLVEELLAES